jgi:hypothetical protein
MKITQLSKLNYIKKNHRTIIKNCFKNLQVTMKITQLSKLNYIKKII